MKEKLALILASRLFWLRLVALVGAAMAAVSVNMSQGFQSALETGLPIIGALIAGWLGFKQPGQPSQPSDGK